MTFDGVSAEFQVQSSTEISAVVPAGAGDGQIGVTVGGATVVSSAPFDVDPTLSGFAPQSGTPGTTVVLTGSGLGEANGVELNGAPLSFQVESSTTVSVVIPAGATSGPISVTTPGGAAASPTNFQVVAAPDFGISALPTGRGRGNADRYLLSISSLNGFSGPVQLSVSGLPSGSSAAFSANPAVTSSVLSISVPRRRDAGGTYTVTIIGTSGNLIHTAQIQVEGR